MNRSELEDLMIKISNNRDQNAFSNLFDLLAPKINAYFIQNGFIPENAEELTQEVMSTVWTKSNMYDPSKSAVSTWIYTISRNKKVDFLRKKSISDINEEDVREYLYEANNTYNSDISDIKSQISKINRELDEKQKKIIKMNFFENKSHKIIAEELEIPLGTVKSRIRHILTKLQKYLV